MDVPAAVKEIRRVLRKNGTLFVSIVHPLADLELYEASIRDSPESQGTYFDRCRFETNVERGGLKVHFAGWARPLEIYVSALESAGLAITSLREPAANTAEGRDHMTRWSKFPLLLWLKARPLCARMLPAGPRWADVGVPAAVTLAIHAKS